MLRIAGVLMLAAGSAMAYIAVTEMYCFYLFGEGGRFSYPGFGFGSFMFGNIAAQVVCYYGIALVLIVLGYGHLRVRCWTRTEMLALVRAWLVIGLPAVLAVFGILLASKDVSVALAVCAGVCLLLSYAVLPWLAIRFYGGRNVQHTFERSDCSSAARDTIPVSILALALLFALDILALHLLVLFNGLFPVFGRWLTGLEGIQALATSILVLAFITWGTLARKRLAWWAALMYFALLAGSVVVSFAVSSLPDLLLTLGFPASEVDFLDGLPLHGYHFAAAFGLPLILTLLMIVSARRHFNATGMQHRSLGEDRPTSDV